MSISKKRIISSLLNAKDGVLRPSYMAVMYAYDLMGKGVSHNSHDINKVIDSDIALTRVTISKLYKSGYLVKDGTNLHSTTDKWNELLSKIDRQARKIK